MEKVYLLALREVRLIARRRLVLATGLALPVLGALVVVVSGGSSSPLPAVFIVLSVSTASLAVLLAGTRGSATAAALRMTTTATVRLAAWGLALVPAIILQSILYLAVLRLAGHELMPGMVSVAAGLAALAAATGARLAIDRD